MQTGKRNWLRLEMNHIICLVRLHSINDTFRKDDTPKLELIHIARLDTNMSRFFYQKKQFQMPQYVPSSLTGAT